VQRSVYPPYALTAEATNFIQKAAHQEMTATRHYGEVKSPENSNGKAVKPINKVLRFPMPTFIDPINLLKYAQFSVLVPMTLILRIPAQKEMPH